jgi:ribosomal protein S18 acetylase RimI-like enzyme
MDFKAQLQDRQLRLVATGRNHTMLTLREEARGPVVGFLEMGLLSPVSAVVQGPDWVNSSAARVPTIGNLVIADSHRRRGLARVLMRAAEDAARGWAQGYIVVAVDPSNSAALALYRSLGYVEVDRSRQKIVKDLMQREVEFLLLVKRLEEGSSPG